MRRSLAVKTSLQVAETDFLAAMVTHKQTDPGMAAVASAIKSTVKGGIGKLRERPQSTGYQRTVERYVKGQFRKPHADLAARLAGEVRMRWQMRVKEKAKKQAATSTGIVVETRARFEHAINPVFGALLFVTFLQVTAAELFRSLRDGRFLAATLVVNFVVVPLVVAAVFAFLPADQAVRVGVLLVLLCPCVDYVIVFSGLAGGSSRRLLAATHSSSSRRCCCSPGSCTCSSAPTWPTSWRSARSSKPSSS